MMVDSVIISSFPPIDCNLQPTQCSDTSRCDSPCTHTVGQHIAEAHHYVGHVSSS